MHLGPGLHQRRAGRIRPHQVVAAVGVQLDDQVARRLDVAGIGADPAAAVAAAGAATAAHLHDDVRETRQCAGPARRLPVGAFGLRGVVQEPHGGPLVGQGLERQQAVEHLRGTRFGIAGKQRGQGVDHHQVQRLLAVQRFQAGDQGEPLGVRWTGALEGATEELDVLTQSESPAASVPVGRSLLGDHDGAAGGNPQARQLSALGDGEAGQQVGQECRFARFRWADEGRDFARRQISLP